MNMSAVLWICVAVSVLFCVVYFFYQSNRTRKAIRDSAIRLCSALHEDYTQPKKQIDAIRVDRDGVTVQVKDGSATSSHTYAAADYALDLEDELSKSGLANYIADAFPELEWKRSIEKSEDGDVSALTGVVLKNVTRLNYKEKIS